jgi:hypothetical protein
MATLVPAPVCDLHEFYHHHQYKASDIDMFIYGLTPKEANKKVTSNTYIILTLDPCNS